MWIAAQARTTIVYERRLPLRLVSTRVAAIAVSVGHGTEASLGGIDLDAVGVTDVVLSLEQHRVLHAPIGVSKSLLGHELVT